MAKGPNISSLQAVIDFLSLCPCCTSECVESKCIKKWKHFTCGTSHLLYYPSCALVWSLYVPCSNEAGDRPRSLWFVMRPGPEKGQACSASFPPWGFLTQNKQKVCFLVLRESCRHLVLHREQNINQSALSLIFSPPLLRQCRTLGSVLVEFSFCLLLGKTEKKLLTN